ncbi:bifunctional RNase H/acid phosphatase [Streptomyces sp. I6]|uniref:bifunctional RNase H/acid phosphatase n=1 Tax=Streptomyces sp. I6 TaxID=2483113 RepID=UPI000F44CC9E|nr:bifunctional RNase H/acid phosphatase [Streptomyces sp. I6]RNL70944.1 bifunctional RNase H/acid phosphatase [Streptomyces sp. I6]
MHELVVEADGGSRGNPGPAGYGAVVRDAASGEPLVERAEYIGVATNNVAEYRGLIAGLKAARELDPGARVHARLDSKLVVEQMSGRWKIKHPDMKPLAAEAARIFPPGQVTYEWIPRERNKHADRLANEAMDAGRRGERWEPSVSSAALSSSAEDVRAARVVGDAAAGAAKARAALNSRAGRDSRAGNADAAGAQAASRASGDAASGGGAVGGAGVGTAVSGGVATGGAAVSGGAAAGGAAVSGGAAAGGAAAQATLPKSTEVEGAGWGPDLGPPATFVLLRHGETALTPEKRFSGTGDHELSEVGRRQAEAVAAALAARGTIQAVVSSPLKRCRQTAEAVAARLGLDVRIDDGLREADFGAWEGLTFAEVRERYGDDLDAWLASTKAAPTGGGESFATVAKRVAATRDRLVREYRGRTVLVVTHVTPIKTLVRLAIGAPPDSLFRMELSAASVSAVAYYADGNASLRLLNDTGHLR